MMSSSEIAQHAENVAVAKARLTATQTLLLGILAGGFIGLGGLFFTLVTSDRFLVFAVSHVMGGLVSSRGLILVILAGAELFTGNNLLEMAWVSRRSSGRIPAPRLLFHRAAAPSSEQESVSKAFHRNVASESLCWGF